MRRGCARDRRRKVSRLNEEYVVNIKSDMLVKIDNSNMSKLLPCIDGNNSVKNLEDIYSNISGKTNRAVREEVKSLLSKLSQIGLLDANP